MLVLGVASIFAKSASTFSWLVSIGTRPILIEFNLKISANLVEIIASNPQSCNPQGACSLEEPVPKLSPATKTFDPLYASLFRIDDFIHISKTNTANIQNGLVGSVMGMDVVLSNNITSTNHNDAVDSDDGALNNANVLGGFVVHNQGLAYAFSKQPTIESEYDIDYIAHKMVGDMIYGSALNQDASQTKVWGIVEEGTTAW